MKKKIFFGLTAAVIAVVTIIACKKNLRQDFGERNTVAGVPTCGNCGTIIRTDTLRGVIRKDSALACNIRWILKGKLYMDDDHVLTIDPGTIIEAVKMPTPAEASAIIITRGSQIEASGSETCPIIFTSAEATKAPGDWGGIVLLGRAAINQADTSIEGINLPTVPEGVEVRYGGGTAGEGDCDDYSGIMTYVRIEYAGAQLTTDNELNGLTCGGVGRSTVLDYIEVYRGNDDAFEFFGGCVNATHLVAFEPDDDAFDFDFGYTGHIQYAVSVLTPGQGYSSNPNGIECDNDGSGTNALPRTRPVLSNLTVIGMENSGDASTAALLNGAHMRRASDYWIYNSIFMGFPAGIHAQSAQPQSSYTNGQAQYNLIHAFTVIDTVKFTSPSGTPPYFGTNLMYTGSPSNSSIQLSNPFAAVPNFCPVTGSPALTTGTKYTDIPGYPFTGTGEIDSVGYRGAFAISTGSLSDWTVNWTRW